MRTDEFEGPIEREGDKRDSEQLFYAGVMIQFSDADGLSALIQSIPSFQCNPARAFQKIGGKKEAQQTGKIVAQVALPVMKSQMPMPV